VLLNAKIVGNRGIWQEFAVFKVQNTPNAMDHILLIIIVTLHGVVKINLTLLDLKPRRANHAHTYSSVLIVRVLMLLTL